MSTVKLAAAVVILSASVLLMFNRARTVIDLLLIIGATLLFADFWMGFRRRNSRRTKA